MEDDSNRQEGAKSSVLDSHIVQARGDDLYNDAYEDQPEVYFVIKRIRFLGKHVGILCQSFNGPCPLLSLINALILRGSITINSCREQIGLKEVQSLRKNTEGAFQIDALLNLIPKLQYGLDVNVQFDNGPQAFEFTEELEAFDATAVTLRHGWLVDPQDYDTYEVIKNRRNYNSCVERLLEYRAAIEDVVQNVGVDTPPLDDDIIKSNKKNMSKLLREGSLIESFLTGTASQLTYYGLSQLHLNVKEREISVFFRNNHFSCMFMLEGRLYLLLTDCGYARLPHTVWELLSDIDGDSVFVNSDFEVEKMNTDGSSYSTYASHGVEASGNVDFMLAYQLQREQEAACKGGEPGCTEQLALLDEELALALQQDFYKEDAVNRRNTECSNISVHSSQPTENRESRHPVENTRPPGRCSVQ